MNFELKKISDWSFFRMPVLENKGIYHGFCTGSSPSDFLHKKTRQDFLESFSLKNIVNMNQEHGSDVHVISDGRVPSSGDGLIILEKNVAGIIKTADCLPIILGDAVHPMVSILHAGWRGTIQGIVRKAMSAMEELGSKKENVLALLGPSIGPCCYEIRDDVYSLFMDDGFPEYIIHKKNKSLFLNLKQANTWLLREGGINKVYDLDLCTCCKKNLFYSFRRGDTGRRQINFVSLKG